MKQIETNILIKATPEKVWNVLTDFEDFPNWNPFILAIKGEKKQGGKLTVSIKPPKGNTITLTPVVLVFDKNKELRWKGKLGINGIFDGEHYFKLKDDGRGNTLFKHGEKFSGILVSFVNNVLIKTKAGFEEMNKALKEKCETE